MTGSVQPRGEEPETFQPETPPRPAILRLASNTSPYAIYCMPIPQDAVAVDRSLLRDDVYRRLLDGIVDGTFVPGEQLKDGELAEWLGVSRTPVREALLRLGASGLVVACRADRRS